MEDQQVVVVSSSRRSSSSSSRRSSSSSGSRGSISNSQMKLGRNTSVLRTKEL